MAPRTTLSFRYAGDVGRVVDEWAREAGFQPVEPVAGARVFQKGTGFLVAPMMLSVAERGGEVHIQAWVRANLLVRLMSLFVLPPEMGIESGGVRGVLPRSIARGAVNQLLDRLGQPAIG